jgi:hypothetical protein
LNPPLIKIQAATAAEVCANFPIQKPAKALLRDAMTPQEFVAALIENKKFVDGIDFMAHALPAREGVWWGCLCMQHAVGEKLAAPERAAATAVVQWVLQPTEENRAAARGSVEGAGPGSAAGTLAMAASLTGGSVAPPNAPFKPPPPFASAKEVAMAVKIASTKADPARITKVQRSYVELALDVAGGKLI